MKNKILITGANGFMGQHLIKFLKEKNFNIAASSRGVSRLPKEWDVDFFSCNITNENEVESLINKTKPNIIVHTAALSKPDECENNKEHCLQVNVKATEYLLQHAKRVHQNVFFIYISTDFIFGENGPHSEHNIPYPLNFYGESILRAEAFVKRNTTNYCIVRPVFMYGKIWEGLRPTFLHWVKKNLEENKPIKVVSDQLRTPTFIDDLSTGIEKIIATKSTGVFHVAGKDIISPYNMAITVATFLNLNKNLIENVNSDTFPEPVKRAKKSGLKINKAIEQLHYNPMSFEEGVRKTFSL